MGRHSPSRFGSIVVACLLALGFTAAATAPGQASGPGAIEVGYSDVDGSMPTSLDFILYRKTPQGWYESRPPTMLPAGPQRFRLGNLQPGTYRLWMDIERSVWEFDRPERAGSFYPDATEWDEAVDITVPPDGTVVLEEMRLRPAGRVTGTVLRESGEDLDRHVRAEVQRWNGKGWTMESDGLVEEDGTFDIRAVGPGPRVLTFVGPSFGTKDRVTFWPDASRVEDAVPLRVEPGETVSLDPIAIAPNGHLDGVVRGPGGHPVAGVEVEAGGIRGKAITGPDGRWDLGPVEAGGYHLQLVDGSGRHEPVTVGDCCSQTGPGPVRVDVRTDADHVATMAFAAPRVSRLALDFGSKREATIGEPITLEWGDLIPTESRVASIEWFVEGRLVQGATGRTITVSDPAEDGNTVTARLRVEANGRSSTLEESAELFLRPNSFQGRPSIPAHRPAVTENLTAASDAVSPRPSSSSSWQWYRDGRAISGATRPSYRVTPADRGKKLSARLVARRDGMEAQTLATSSSGAVTSTTPKVSVSVVAKGKKAVRITAKASHGRVSDSYMDGRLDVYRSRSGSDLLTTVTMTDGRASASLSKQPKGAQKYYVRFRPSRDGFTTVTSTKRRTTVR